MEPEDMHHHHTRIETTNSNKEVVIDDRITIFPKTIRIITTVGIIADSEEVVIIIINEGIESSPSHIIFIHSLFRATFA